MPHIEATEGAHIFEQLTQNDSWIRATYFLVKEATTQIEFPTGYNIPLLRQAAKLQADVLACIPQNEEQARVIDSQKTHDLANFIAQNNGGLIVMRHGKQYVEDEERKLLPGSSKKIKLMQLPFNDEDPADAQSLAEAASIALILKDISSRLQIPVDIWTSRNARAADIAAIISLANGSVIHIDNRLTCVNYPGDVSIDVLDKKIGEDNNGALVWKREIIDRVCGKGTFDRISQDMTDIISNYTQNPIITVCITHTPQMNAADALAGCTPTRIPELGFRVFGKNSSLQFPGSIFVD